MTDENALVALPAGQLHTLLVVASQQGDITGMLDVRAMAVALTSGAKARGLGIESENQGAELILRAEREIGGAIGRLKAARLFGTVGNGGPVRDRLIAELESGPASARELTARTGLPHKSVAQVLHNNPAFAKVDDRKGGQWRLEEDRVAALRALVRIHDMGITETESAAFQKLAAVPADVFESTVAETIGKGKRLSRVVFAPMMASNREARPKTTASEAYAMVRDGMHLLLGWDVGEDGVGYAKAPILLDLANDELAGLAELVKAFVPAYGDARRARG